MALDGVLTSEGLFLKEFPMPPGGLVGHYLAASSRFLHLSEVTTMEHLLRRAEPAPNLWARGDDGRRTYQGKIPLWQS